MTAADNSTAQLLYRPIQYLLIVT